MTDIRQLALDCRAAAQAVALLSTDARNAMLRDMADRLLADGPAILSANAQDLAAAREKGVAEAMFDRLRLDDARLAGIADALREVAALPDPVGQVTRSETRPNGILVERVRTPLGVVAMIYEARPNVTADAAALCLKAGNGVILRGGSEALRSNVAIAAALGRALEAAGVPAAAMTIVQDLRRETMVELLQLSDIVDLAIPRGGEGLIRFVAEHARVPVIKHYKGVCHLFVDASADLDLAERLLVDGKVSRPSACNALETLLVHARAAPAFLPRAAATSGDVVTEKSPGICCWSPHASRPVRTIAAGPVQRGAEGRLARPCFCILVNARLTYEPAVHDPAAGCAPGCGWRPG